MPKPQSPKSSLGQPQSLSRVATRTTQDNTLGTMALVLFALGMIASLWLS